MPTQELTVNIKHTHMSISELTSFLGDINTQILSLQVHVDAVTLLL